VIAIVFLALIGLSLLEEFSNWSHLFVAAFFVYVVILIIFFSFLDKFINMVPIFLPKRYKERFKNINLTRKVFLSSIALSFGIWIVLSIQAFLILNSLGISTSILIVISIVPLMALSSIVPFSLGGIGIREIIAISFLLVIGITAEKSAIFSLFYTFISTGVPAIIGGFLHLFYKKKSNM